jgi:hypothetical protein
MIQGMQSGFRCIFQGPPALWDGDFLQVMVMAGKDVGLTGTIQKVIRSQNRVIVEGRNLVRRVFGIGIEIQVGKLSKHMRSFLLGQNLSIEPPGT